MKHKIYIISSIMCFITLLSSLRAQTVIPYLPMQKHFGGSAVGELENFTLPEGNFTLEVTGTVGQEVSIGNGHISYTPAESGTVRFAKYSEVVYIYENGVYKQSEIPAPLSVTYSTTNLFQNPGFETNTADGSNFKDGVYWHVYNNAKNELWGNGGSIRTTKYEGDYSILMRNEGIYLTQQISGLKANTYYKISYYHRSNTTAQGGSNYQIELGSSEFGTEGGVCSAHTTSAENTNWALFETEIKTSNVVPTWFTLHRLTTGNKYDYLDNFSILEGNITAKGISGATAATFLDGMAYAPEITLGANDVFDMTPYYFLNPDFEADSPTSSSASFVPSGWSGTYTVGTSKISSTEKGSGLIEGSPNLHYQIYNGSGIAGKLFQHISGLPEGSYKVQAAICPGNADGNICLYANTGRTIITTTNNLYEAEGVVTNGELEIGLDIAKIGAVTIDIDHFRLYYYGKYNEAVITANPSYLPFSTDDHKKTFTINGYGLHSDIILSAPEGSGITFSPSIIPASSSQNIAVTVTFDATGLPPYHINTGLLSIECEGAQSATIAFSADPLSGAIPYIPMLNDFGGSAVSDLSDFTPSVGDFTLEVTGAMAGQEITVGNGYFSYVPTASGTVRFVQKSDLVSNKVFVYENGKYKAQLRPTPVLFSATNLFNNPGFETATADGSYYKDGVSWNVYNAEKTATWQTDGSIRTTRKTGGSYSLLMRDPAVYLTQEIDGLKANTYYKISYYYSSNTMAQGAAEYQIELGSSQFATDGGIYPAHTTSIESTDWIKYETVIKTGAIAPTWFSLHRQAGSNKFDWFDDFRMEEGAFTIGNGISGVYSASYLKKMAYAPEIEEIAGTIYDMTCQFVVNPEFEKDAPASNDTGFSPIGWTKGFNSTTSRISTEAKADGATIVGGQNHWQTISNGSVLGKMEQLIVGLPPGKYLVRAGIYPLFEGAVSLYAGNTKKMLTSDVAAYYEVETTISDGTLNIGLELETNSILTSIDFDHVSLIYFGEDIEGYKQLLQKKLALANANVSNSENPGYFNLSQLQDAITTGNSAEETAGGLLAAINALDEAIETYSTILAAYKPLKTALKNASELLANSDYSCKSDYQYAVNTAQAVYVNVVDQRSNIASALAALNAATNVYYDCAELPAQQIVSHVDNSLNGSQKYVLRIGEKPFYMNNIQVRFDKLRHVLGWDAEKIERVFAQAAADNFNAITIAIHWIEVEPEKDVFDWSVLDEYLSLSKKYNLKLELIWMGSNSGGRVQPLVGDILRTPAYVMGKTPAGSEYPTVSDYTIRRDMTDYTLDMADVELRDREASVVGKFMSHVAIWDTAHGSTHPLVGIQLGNEVKGYGIQFSNDVVLSYWSKVGEAVKNSPYVVWTRMNCIEGQERYEANETMRASKGSNIDIVGIDLYRKTAKQIREWLPYIGNNFRYIMECGANDDQSAIVRLAALSGNNSLNYYNMVGTESLELYDITGDIFIPHGDYVDDVRTVNKLFKSANTDLAINAQGYGLFVHNWEGKSAASTTGIEGIAFTPASSISQAVCIRRSNTEIVLLNTKGGTFTYPESLGIIGASKGYFDDNNVWVDEGDIEFTSTSITPPRATVVRLICTDSGQRQVDNIYQTEFADYGDGVTFDSTPSYLGFAGNGAVLFPSSGGYLEWTDLDDGGNASTISLRYALAGSASLSGNLIVNGVSQNIAFEPTGANDVYRTVSMTTAVTNNGTNTVRLEPVTNLNGLYLDELQIVNGNDMLTEMEVPDKSQQILAYPNPVASVLSLNLPTNITEGDIKILDLMGKVIVNCKLTANKTDINVCNLSPGLYVLYVKTNAHTFIQKIQKRNR